MHDLVTIVGVRTVDGSKLRPEERPMETMNRRRAIQMTGAAFAAAGLGMLGCKPAESAEGASSNAALAQSASDCIAKGDACVAHCEQMIAGGDRSMDACLSASREMVANMKKVNELAQNGSPELKAAAATARASCEKCIEACRAHAQTHPVCDACMRACEHSVTELKRVEA